MRNIPLIAFRESTLKMLSSIRHAFFTPEGEVSTGRDASLNCAYASEDDPTKVLENRIRTTAYFELSVERLVAINNIYSNNVVVVDKPYSSILYFVIPRTLKSCKKSNASL